ncbi:hypothetical protein NE237_005266 [Protea cynaroides]|uniref:Myb/SANT-like DNA-binding domain-containing protein n=1 Tax=Protea cynaroides TaxID=273540 RepID=A0A9Q0KKG3_9MAGN|nr:hypothetical protein NE237_005266 [Protea cynaroides]
MNNLVMNGGFLSGSTGILELEPSIHRHRQSYLSQVNLSHQHHIQVDQSDHSSGLMEPKGTGTMGRSTNYGKVKGTTKTANVSIYMNPNSNTSSEDEPSHTEDGNEHFNGAKGKKGSLWQRMKWTDDIVRLLVTVVSLVGDDGFSDGVDGLKRKSGVLQKKGKWKTVSNIMMEKGCFVSPQQCEDKFNDLNKRYKRLNEILGRGTTCRVVENPVLLDSMTHISPKMKDVVRKILSSKQLFYKEMCAHHNGQRIPNSHDLGLQGYSIPTMRCSKDGNAFEEEEENEDDDDDVDNEDDNNVGEDAEKVGEFCKRKKMNERGGNFWPQSGGHDSFEAEMAGMLQDASKTPWEQREWIKNRMLLLQERRVSFQVQAFELEKRRFKWKRFCSKKDGELERLKLDNERMRLENQQMTLQVKWKELEIDLKQSEAYLNPFPLGIDGMQGRDLIELGNV